MPRVCLSFAPNTGDPWLASWLQPTRHLSVWNEVRVTPSIKNSPSSSIVVSLVYFCCTCRDYSCAAWPSYFWSQWSQVDFLTATKNKKFFAFGTPSMNFYNFTAILITKEQNIIPLHTTFAIVLLCNTVLQRLTVTFLCTSRWNFSDCLVWFSEWTTLQG